MAIQTGCEILVKLEDLADKQYYATNSLRQAYRQGNLCEIPGESIVSGETGLPITQMVETAVQSCGGDSLNYNGVVGEDGRAAASASAAYNYISTDSANIRHAVPMNFATPRGQVVTVPQRHPSETDGYSWTSQPHMVAAAAALQHSMATQMNPTTLDNRSAEGASGVAIKLEDDEEDDEDDDVIEETSTSVDADQVEYQTAQQQEQHVNMNQNRSVVVVEDDNDEVEMEDEVEDRQTAQPNMEASGPGGVDTEMADHVVDGSTAEQQETGETKYVRSFSVY